MRISPHEKGELLPHLRFVRQSCRKDRIVNSSSCIFVAQFGRANKAITLAWNRIRVVFQHEGLALVKLNVIVRSSFVVAMELPQTVFNKLVKQVGFTIITVYDDGVGEALPVYITPQPTSKKSICQRRKGCYCLTDLGLYISNMKCGVSLNIVNKRIFEK